MSPRESAAITVQFGSLMCWQLANRQLAAKRSISRNPALNEEFRSNAGLNPRTPGVSIKCPLFAK